MGLMDNLKKVMISQNDDDRYDEEYEDEETEEVVEPAKPASNKFTPSVSRPVSNYSVSNNDKMQVVVVEPKDFETCQKIATHIRESRPVLINFENTDSHVAARIVDFVSGAIFALDGRIQKISKHIFLVAPNSVVIDCNDKPYSNVMPATTWKETEI